MKIIFEESYVTRDGKHYLLVSARAIGNGGALSEPAQITVELPLRHSAEASVLDDGSIGSVSTFSDMRLIVARRACVDALRKSL